MGKRICVRKGAKMPVALVGRRKARSALPLTEAGRSSWKGADCGDVAILYDPSAGDGAKTCAEAVLECIDDLMQWCDALFGTQGKGGNVIVEALGGASDGSGGAQHASCAFNSDSPGGSDWEVDVAEQDPQITVGLTVAEVVESYMGLQAKGWNCGSSGGEALSRVLAEIYTGGADGPMKPYETAPSYDGSNWIDSDQGTDFDYPSIGCGVLYLWWMIYHGFTIEAIVDAGCDDGSLASNWAKVTGKDQGDAWTAFRESVTALGEITSDNPWQGNGGNGGGGGPPTPPPSGTLTPGTWTLPPGTTLTVPAQNTKG